LRENPSSLEAATGAAVAAWPDRTLERLETLAERSPSSAVVRLNFGLALFAAGDLQEARDQWREAELREPDSPAALRAEDLRNPESPPGRPRFLFARPAPRSVARLPLAHRIAKLKARASGQGGLGNTLVPGRIDAWILLGTVYEQIGHRLSAQRAYDQALALDPESLEARVATAVARFDKDRPEEAFSRLGPLTRERPRAAVVRYHLGLLLLWLPNVEEAKHQLRLARGAGVKSLYGRQAARLLERLDETE
jgi:tetratricopeptide (TPR) repeat protein